MRTVDVIIPTRMKGHVASSLPLLRHIPWPIKLHLVTEGRDWWEAVNIGLAERTPGNDVLLMDDDVFLKADTLSTVDEHYSEAECFGFKLLYPDGKIQHGGGIVHDSERVHHMGWGQKDTGQCDRLLYVCHLTTSLIYIKNDVIERLGGMAEDYPGMQFEDVDFCFRAIQAGLRLLYLPQAAVHLQSATKKARPDFMEKLKLNEAEIQRRWFSDKEFVTLARSFPREHEQVELSHRNGTSH